MGEGGPDPQEKPVLGAADPGKDHELRRSFGCRQREAAHPPALRDGDILLWGAAKANEQIKGSALKVIPETPGTVHTVRPDLFVQEALAFIQQ